MKISSNLEEPFGNNCEILKIKAARRMRIFHYLVKRFPTDFFVAKIGFDSKFEIDKSSKNDEKWVPAFQIQLVK